MTQWQLKVLTQAELASAGVAFYGPWPPPSIKPVPTADVTLSVVQKVHRARLTRQLMRRRVQRLSRLGPTAPRQSD